jgi:hypothetical protein
MNEHTAKLLREADENHRKLCAALGKEKPTLYSALADEIRRLEALLKMPQPHR